MNKAVTTVALATSLALSTSAMAAGVNISSNTTSYQSDSCHLQMKNTLSVSPTRIEITNQEDEKLVIINGDTLYIDNQQVNLTGSQQVLVSSYASGLNDGVPKVITIAMEGVDIAIHALDTTFGELLGRDSSGFENLMDSMDDLQVALNHKFKQGDSWVLDANANSANDFLGEDFEQEIESAVEEAVRSSIGSLLITLGKEMLFSGSDMESFEQRMESFAAQMEQDVEQRAEVIEEKAEQLCHSFYQLELVENQLQQQIPELKAFDVFDTSKKNEEI